MGGIGPIGTNVAEDEASFSSLTKLDLNQFCPGARLATESQLAYFSLAMSSTRPHLIQADNSACPYPTLCPLNRVRVGSAVRIRSLAAPPEVQDRLRELGFCEDQQVRLLSRQTNVICIVCNARLGLSARLAQAILVEPLAPATTP